MSWAARFRTVQYLKQSLWIYPFVGAILGVLLALLTRVADTVVRAAEAGSGRAEKPAS